MSGIPSYRALTADINKYSAAYRKEAPEVMKAFGELARAATSAGALDEKTKELIAIGISVAIRCDGCIGAHVAAALKAGATKQELIETIDVAVLMGGGPAIIYGTQALAAVEELSAE